MKAKQATALALGLMFLALPTSATSSFAYRGWPTFGSYAPQQQQQLSLSLSGATLSAGTQHYSVSGGQVLFASVMGEQVNASSALLSYSYQATVAGSSTSGLSALQLTGTTLDGQPVTLTAQGMFGDMAHAVDLPLGCTVGVNCVSSIPAAFLGMSSVSMSVGSTSSGAYSVPTEFESPYLSPWGGPIVIAAADNSFVVVTTYNQGSITWSNVQVGGVASGAFNGSPVSGNFAMTVNSYENLVTGFEADSGTVAFSGMSNAALNMQGWFLGYSTIPTQGAYSCAGGALPAGPCTEPGLNSYGLLSLSSGKVKLEGSYQTVWTCPAIAFTSSVSVHT
jgi:hypothetical protein